jgi:hypothetical protein
MREPTEIRHGDYVIEARRSLLVGKIVSPNFFWRSKKSIQPKSKGRKSKVEFRYSSIFFGQRGIQLVSGPFSFLAAVLFYVAG